MFILQLIGIFGGVIVGLFFPRTLLAIVVGNVLGGWWWCIFAPLVIVGFFVDLCAL